MRLSLSLFFYDLRRRHHAPVDRLLSLYFFIIFTLCVAGPGYKTARNLHHQPSSLSYFARRRRCLTSILSAQQPVATPGELLNASIIIRHIAHSSGGYFSWAKKERKTDAETTYNCIDLPLPIRAELPDLQRTSIDSPLHLYPSAC